MRLLRLIHMPRDLTKPGEAKGADFQRCAACSLLYQWCIGCHSCGSITLVFLLLKITETENKFYIKLCAAHLLLAFLFLLYFIKTYSKY